MKTLTIPQLRKSFDHIDQWVNSHITKPTKQLVPAFQAEWKKVFGRVVEAAAAAAYLDLKRSKGKTRRVGRPLGQGKGDQKGGAAPLAGAPLDYTTHQGSYGVYGQFPAYQAAGLALPADSFSASCGNGELKTVIPADMGYNDVVQKGGKGRLGRPKGSTRKKQRGGNLFSGAAASVMSSLDTMANRPFFAGSPPTAAYTAQMAAKGVDTVVPLPAQTVYSPQAYNPVVLGMGPSAIQANLPAQLRTGSI
jgi:hypothetical protein